MEKLKLEREGTSVGYIYMSDISRFWSYTAPHSGYLHPAGSALNKAGGQSVISAGLCTIYLNADLPE